MRLPFFVPLIVLGLVSAPGASAQNVTGSVEGWVMDSGGAPLAGAEILVRGTGLPQARLTRSGSRGYYRFDQLPVGEYQVILRLVGYRPAVIERLPVHLGRQTAAGVAVLVAAVVQLSDLAVTAERPLIEVASAAGGANLASDRFDELPFERSYRSIPAVLPSATMEREGLNVMGGTGQDNLWFIDGANVTNSLNGASSTVIPYNFIREVEVRTGGYEAEYRGALGGLINVVTQSGGEQLRGEIFGYFQNNSISGNDRMLGGSTPPGSFALFDVGGSIGGPLVRNRMWFFAAYAPAIERQTVGLGSLGSFTDRSTRHSFAGKLTFQPSAATTIVASLIGDPTERDAVAGSASGIVNPDPWLRRLRVGGTSVSVNVSHALSDQVLITAAGAVARQRDDDLPATALGLAEPPFIDATGVISGGTWVNQRVSHRTASVRLSALWSTGAHQVKLGGEVNELGVSGFSRFWEVRQTPTHYRLDYQLLQGSVRNRIVSLFLQDSWMATNRLRVNAGLRWDGERSYGSDGGLSLSIMDEFQPRVGFVFQPGTAGRSRIFGSWGRFYENLFTSLGAAYFTYGSVLSRRRFPQDPRADSTNGMTVFYVPTQRGPDPGLEGQSQDEWSLGYERALSPRLKATLRGTWRRLRWGIEDGNGCGFGNPGRGCMSDLPRMLRDYAALELSLQGELSTKLWVLASYVLSRSHGNYPGLYDSDGGYSNSNWSGAFDIPEILVNSTGRLPNDRPHQLKASGSLQIHGNLVAGASLSYLSGKPLSELGTDASGYNPFLSQRGTAGRAAGFWDLGARLAWSPGLGAWATPRLVLDLYHIGSPRSAVDFDQVRFLDPGQQFANPNYRAPTAFQPPMAARLGLVAAL